MADIQIVYREGECGCDYSGDIKDYDIQCHTSCAGDKGCVHYRGGGVVKEKSESGVVHIIIPFGDCEYAKWNYKFKGWTGKRYEMEELRDPYNPHLDSMNVKLGNAWYDCVKVILDGKCIFNVFDDDK